MKDIVTKIYESNEWNPSLNSHKQAYNSFIKWYDRQLNHMNKEELTDMLKTIYRGERMNHVAVQERIRIRANGNVEQRYPKVY